MPTNLATPQDFDRFVDAHLPELVGTASRLTRSRAAAEDLVQDAVLRAWQSRGQFAEGTNARAWMYRILMNTFISSYRRRRRERDVLASPEFEMDEEFWPEELHADGVGDEVESALSSLPEDFRSVVLAVDVDEQTYREVADALGMPIGTVMSRLHRARRQLKVSLREYAVAEGYAARAA